ncbi:TetR/AcrR family transcriptional regulator [Lactobacillus corticis]|uniref:TetR family transcriptional regulator n=1 Tax=Lactobacillus corticis TaxID=2201249 RepID=A0A916VI48_9LACO|nr:TetR/AcrR family transcriptional regulator [Lactobacillus corticis]GFZ27377.1 TetR family transcriptional regulator [Lactobacillus corticis]
MEKKLDLRVQKTYKALTESCLKLLGKKPFESITVNEICEEAMVRRATFYKHFADKYELFEFITHEFQRNFADMAKKMNTSDREEGYFLNSIVLVLNFLDQNKTLYRLYATGNLPASLMTSLEEACLQELDIYIRNLINNGVISPIPPDVLKYMLSGAILNAAKWWYYHRNTVTKEEMTTQMQIFIRNAIGIC